MKKDINRMGIPVVMLLVSATAIALFQKLENPAPSGHRESASSGAVTRSAYRAPEPDGEGRRKESISLAAQKWYEELLEKHPEMKPVYRDVADEENGYLQYLLLAEAMEKPILPIDWVNMAFQGDSDWDPVKFQAWLSQHQDYLDEILRIAELPDCSAKGIDLDRFVKTSGAMYGEFTGILRASARLAFENGDQETALRHMKASVSMGDHLIDIETPSMLLRIVSSGIRERALDCFRENFLPTLAKDTEALRRWQEVIFREEKPAAEYARAISGEWHSTLRLFLLPALLGDDSAVENASAVGDVTELIDAFTRSVREVAAGVSHSGADRFDVSQAMGAFPPLDGPVTKTTGNSVRITVEGLLFSLRIPVRASGVEVTRTAMNSAAISILLGEVPTVDPVSGEAFAWDPETRTLSVPGREDVLKPIILPGKD